MARFSSSSARTVDLFPTAAVLGIAPFWDVRFHAILPELETLIGIWKWALIEAGGGTRAGTTLPSLSLLPVPSKARYTRDGKVDIIQPRRNKYRLRGIFHGELENCRGDPAAGSIQRWSLERMSEKTRQSGT